jgi:MFS family permease
MPESDELRSQSTFWTTGSHVRLKVLAGGVALAGITYLDRVCISRLADNISADLHLTPTKMGWVFSAFIIAYALFEIPTGAWCDVIGARRVLTRIVAWWSSFTMATALSFNYASLLTCRFLFGAGEAGAWPTMTRALSRWFPAWERGTAQGIIFMGAHLAGGLTPILVGRMMNVFTWRQIFMIFGAIGFVWAAWWSFWFRDEPAGQRAVDPAERDYIESGRTPDLGHRLDRSAVKELLKSRSLWALCAMYFTQAYGFYFYITWLPKYLTDVRGFSSKSDLFGLLAGLPLVFSAVADVVGGLTTDRVTRRYGLRAGRCGVGAASLLVAGISMIAGASTSHALAAALLIGLAGAAGNFLLGSCWGVCVDIAGGRAGVISACMNSAGQIGGAICPVVIGWFVDPTVRSGPPDWYTPLVFNGALYLCGAACWWFVDPAKPLFAKPAKTAED